MTHPFALNPIQWLATDDGWLDFERQLDAERLLLQIKQAGFNAVMAEAPPGYTLDRYSELARQVELQMAPAFFAARSDGSSGDRKAILEAAASRASEQAALGLAEIFLGLGMSKGSARVEHPAEGREADSARLTRLIGLVQDVAEVMVQEGVRPVLHPHVGTWIETEAETRAVLDAVDGTLLGFGPDTGHLAWAGADVVGLISDYRDRVSSVHIKDCRMSVARRGIAEGLSYQETVMAGLWVEPGRGELDLAAMLGALGREFEGWLIVEVDRPDLPDPEQSAIASATWMSTHLPALGLASV